MAYQLNDYPQKIMNGPNYRYQWGVAVPTFGQQMYIRNPPSMFTVWRRSLLMGGGDIIPSMTKNTPSL